VHDPTRRPERAAQRQGDGHHESSLFGSARTFKRQNADSFVLATPCSERTGRTGTNRALVVMLSTLALAQAGCTRPVTEPIFNGRDLTGWHVSVTNHHGESRAWRVEDGVLVGSQGVVWVVSC
jgi:hypothetical protein